jgi:hypothetical protein
MKQALSDENCAYTKTVITERRRVSEFVKVNEHYFYINYGCVIEGSNGGEYGDYFLLGYDIV